MRTNLACAWLAPPKHRSQTKAAAFAPSHHDGRPSSPRAQVSGDQLLRFANTGGQWTVAQIPNGAVRRECSSPELDRYASGVDLTGEA